MRITVVAMGTRGDVQPILALAQGLRAAGHAIRILAGANFEGWVRSFGFDFVPSLDMVAVMRSPDGLRWTQSSHSPLMQLRIMARILEQHERALTLPLMALREDTDLIVSGFVSEPFVQALSEASGTPYVNTFLQPYAPTRDGAASLNALLTRRRSLVNLLVSTLAPRIVWALSAGPVNRLRQTLGLPSHTTGSYIRATRRVPTAFGYSPHVSPFPDDWTPEKAVTGYWFLEERAGWQPPDALLRFFDTGPLPVYIGFGSMSASDPKATMQLIAEAVTSAGQRAVVGSGWSELNGYAPPSNIYVVDGVPHDWLFERVAAVVHHGGSGTTGAGLRAGKSTMIVPHMADQPYWGRRVHDLGVGIAPVPRHKLTVERLADGLRRLVEDRTLRENVAALGEQIRAEDGVGTAVRHLMNHAPPHHQS